MSAERRFRTVVAVDRRGRTIVPVPFDPDEAWGVKSRHPVRGTVGGCAMRGNVEKHDDGPAIALGPTWTRLPLPDGAEVEVVLEPEGPQRADLAPDIAAALDAAPDAGAFFDSLAQFYRNAWLRWIDATKAQSRAAAGAHRGNGAEPAGGAQDASADPAGLWSRHASASAFTAPRLARSSAPRWSARR